MGTIIYSKMKRKKYIIAGLLIAALGQVLTHTYRPYIYENHIADFHIADTIGSLLCVPAATLCFYGFSNKYTINKLIFMTTLVYISYEFLGLLHIHGTFDFYDIIAIIISSICSFYIFKTLKV